MKPGKPNGPNHPEKAPSPKHTKKEKKITPKTTVVGKVADKKVTSTPPRTNNENNNNIISKKEDEKVVVPNFISKVKIAESFTTGKVTIHEYSNCKETINEGAIIIEGVPNGSTITNIITTSHLVEYLKLPLVAEVVSPSFPPVTVVQYGIPAPGARIYANKEIVVLACDYSLQEPEITHDFISAIFSFAERYKVGGIITLDALSANPSKVTSLLDQIQLATEEPEDADGVDEGDEYAEIPSDVYSLTPDDVGSGDGSVSFAGNDGEDFQVPHSIQAKKHPPQKKELHVKNEAEKAHEKASSAQSSKKEVEVVTSDASSSSSSSNAADDKKADDKQVWFLTNSQTIGDFLKSISCEPVVEVSLSGIQAGLINHSRFSDVPVILLLAKLDKLELGASPALLLIQTIEKLLKNLWGEHCCNVDISKLEESTKSLEDKLNEILKKLQPQRDDTSNMLYM